MEGKAPQSGTVSGPAASKREVRRMIRERIGGLDAAAREAMSRSICRYSFSSRGESVSSTMLSMRSGICKWSAARMDTQRSPSFL